MAESVKKLSLYTSWGCILSQQCQNEEVAHVSISRASAENHLNEGKYTI